MITLASPAPEPLSRSHTYSGPTCPAAAELAYGAGHAATAVVK